MSAFVSLQSVLDTKGLDRLYDQLNQAEDLVFDVMRVTVDEIRPAFLQGIRQNPPPPKYPIQWTSEKQRKAHWATKGFGKGIPYQRTGDINDSWVMFAGRATNGVEVIIFTRSSSAKFVGGTLAKDDYTAYKYIQQFHRNTGWKPFKPIVETYVERTIELFTQKIIDAFGNP